MAHPAHPGTTGLYYYYPSKNWPSLRYYNRTFERTLCSANLNNVMKCASQAFTSSYSYFKRYLKAFVFLARKFHSSLLNEESDEVWTIDLLATWFHEYLIPNLEFSRNLGPIYKHFSFGEKQQQTNREASTMYSNSQQTWWISWTRIYNSVIS